MKRGLCQLYLICFLALLAALLAAWFHPRRPSTRASDVVPSINVAQVSALAKSRSVLWIDARPEIAFNGGHIPGARRLTTQDWESLLPGVFEVWNPTDVIIVYCDHLTCDASKHVADRLGRELQLGNIYVLEGGWEAWNRSLKR